MPGWRAPACLLAALWLAAAPAAAQEVSLQPSATESCLMPLQEERGLPVYPEVPRLRNSEGRVKVQLSFAAPDQPPTVQVLETDPLQDPAFVESVLKHVAVFRVPCLQTVDAPARLVLDFSFKPDHRQVFGQEPQDPDRARRQAGLSCLQHASGRLQMAYPRRAQEREIEGRVLAELRFTAPDQPPEVTIVARPRAGVLASAVRDWAQGFRLPCLQEDSLRLSLQYHFYFRESAYGFSPDTRMMQFLAAIKGIQRQRVLFDFNTMDCPFDVELYYYQPLRPNRVRTLGSWHAERAAFLRWLSTAELDLPERELDRVFGASVRFAVPCTKIDHHPKE